MTAGKRPLSPHLQIYRPQITSVLSISHRFTGAALSAGLLVMVYWLVALAQGDAAYAQALVVLTAWPVQVALLLGVFAFFYHLCNGLRHLWWDTGRGFEITAVNRSGWIVLIVSAALTGIFWALMLSGGGA